MPDEIEGCPCCGEPTEGGLYAGTSREERERHRARATRQRGAVEKALRAREVEASGVLAALGLAADCPAEDVAAVLESTINQMAALTVVVRRDLVASNADEMKVREQVMQAQHRVEVSALQARCDELQAAGREAAERVRGAAGQVAESGAALSAALQARDVACEEAVAARSAMRVEQTAGAQAEATAAVARQEALRAGAVAREAGERAAAAQFAQRESETARVSAVAQADATRLSVAQVLAEQENRFSERMLEALRQADLRATRERNAALRFLRQGHSLERKHLLDEVARAQGG